MSLFSMLSATARSLDAQRLGLDVVGQNIANVNTPGYTRRVVTLADVPPPDRYRAGGGVEATGIRALRDRFIERRLRAELPAEQREAAVAGSLSVVEVALGAPGQSIDRYLNDFFDGFARLAEAPTSATARQEVVLQGQTLAAAFRDMAARFDASQRDTDTRIRASVEQVNELASRVAGLNASLSGVPSDSAESLHLRDQINTAVAELSRIVEVEAIERPDGGWDLSVAGGRALVIGEHAYALGVSADPGTGFARLVTANGDDVTAGIRNGALGGLLHVRDTLVPQYQGALDELAWTVADRINAVHAGGFDLNGDPGGALFALTVTPVAGFPHKGAAASLSVVPALTDPGGEARVAASATGEVGDNEVARALTRLRDELVLGGGTASFNAAWAQLVYRVGRDTAAALDEQGIRSEVLRQVENLRDAVSGVSLDEEAADMLRFQRAYEANARFFQTVDDTLSVLMRMVGA